MPVGHSLLPWGTCTLLWRSALIGPVGLREGGGIAERPVASGDRARLKLMSLPFGAPHPCRSNAGWSVQPSHSHCTGSCGPRNTCPPGAQGRKLSVSSTLCSLVAAVGRTWEQVWTCFLLECPFPFLLLSSS